MKNTFSKTELDELEALVKDYLRVLEQHRGRHYEEELLTPGAALIAALEKHGGEHTVLLRLIGLARNVLVPIPMELHCPECGLQHIDAPNPDRKWTNPPHRSHECQGCGTIWRPADIATEGVERIQTRGQCDQRVVAEEEPNAEQILEICKRYTSELPEDEVERAIETVFVKVDCCREFIRIGKGIERSRVAAGQRSDLERDFDKLNELADGRRLLLQEMLHGLDVPIEVSLGEQSGIIEYCRLNAALRTATERVVGQGNLETIADSILMWRGAERVTVPGEMHVRLLELHKSYKSLDGWLAVAGETVRLERAPKVDDGQR